MVNLEEFPGISVTVCVEGKPLKEYSDDAITDEDGTVIRYIEAVTGKNFEVHLGVEKGTNITRSHIGCHVRVDGSFVGYPLILKSNFSKANFNKIIDGRYVDADTVQKLSFATLDTGNLFGRR
jgi:hypothetical protein